MAAVARVAGMSLPTLSRVLTGAVAVSPDKRARVLAAIEQLGYRPNAAARALVSGRRSLIAVLAGNTSLYGYARTISRIAGVARRAGYTVVITVVESADAEVVERLPHEIPVVSAGAGCVAGDRSGPS